MENPALTLYKPKTLTLLGKGSQGSVYQHPDDDKRVIKISKNTSVDKEHYTIFLPAIQKLYKWINPTYEYYISPDDNKVYEVQRMVNQTASDLPKSINLCILLLKFLTIVDKSKICHSDLWLGNIGVTTTSTSPSVSDLVLIDTAELHTKTTGAKNKKCKDIYSMLVSLFDVLV